MKSPAERAEKNGFLYESVAGRVAHMIERGTFRPGARLPSVRRLSQQLQVSITTVTEAYRLLEDQGRIEARPQSGYYVRACLPEALRYALDETPIRAVHLVCNVSNPLGSSMPDARKEELVAMLAEREIPLIEDDVYGDLYFASPRPKVAKAFDRNSLVLLCSSFSKTIAPGYRVGYTAPGRFLAEVQRLKFVSNLATATLPQLAVAEFLANGGYDHHLRRIRRAYSQQVAALAQAVMAHFPPGTKVTRPTGGFVLWVETPEVDSLQLYERALERGITFAPGPMFSAKQKYRTFFRLTAAFWSERVEAAIATLGELAGELQRGGAGAARSPCLASSLASLISRGCRCSAPPRYPRFRPVSASLSPPPTPPKTAADRRGELDARCYGVCSGSEGVAASNSASSDCLSAVNLLKLGSSETLASDFSSLS